MKFGKDTQQTAKLALAIFGFAAKRITPLKGGQVNSAFVVIDSRGRKRVLRIYQYGRKKRKAIEHEIAFMERLRQAALPVPKIFAARGSNLAVFKDEKNIERFAILMEFVQGRHLRGSDLGILPEFARIQARMHIAAEKFKPLDFRRHVFLKLYDWMDFEFNLALKKCKSENVRKQLLGIYKSVHAEVRKNLSKIIAAPGRDVHLDYDSDNILVSSGRIKAILDFDDLSNLPFSLDIANSLWWWLIHNDPKCETRIITEYLFNYQKVRKITAQETALIPLFMRMRNLTIGALAIAKGGKSEVVRRTRTITNMDARIRACKI